MQVCFQFFISPREGIYTLDWVCSHIFQLFVEGIFFDQVFLNLSLKLVELEGKLLVLGLTVLKLGQVVVALVKNFDLDEFFKGLRVFWLRFQFDDRFFVHKEFALGELVFEGIYFFFEVWNLALELVLHFF